MACDSLAIQALAGPLGWAAKANKKKKSLGTFSSGFALCFACYGVTLRKPSGDPHLSRPEEGLQPRERRKERLEIGRPKGMSRSRQRQGAGYRVSMRLHRLYDAMSLVGRLA